MEVYAHTDLNVTNRKIQGCMAAVVRWSTEKKVDINVEKNMKSQFFPQIQFTKEVKWRPTITALGKDVPFSSTPKFLGVHLDRTSSFAKHEQVVTDKVKKRNRMLANRSSNKWFWRKR